jgi:hypothetical protein
MLKNWKTTIFGISAILGGITTIIKGDIGGGATAILSGFGLLFAKDM